MRKLIGFGFIVLFAASFFIGAMVSPAAAVTPGACTYRCINQDWHFCCISKIYPFEEICVWHQYECTLPIYD
ncbi:MAG: hypothetical protein R3F48_17860 [Candidatus Zixiibacteriota bacterium]